MSTTVETAPHPHPLVGTPLPLVLLALAGPLLAPALADAAGAPEPGCLPSATAPVPFDTAVVRYQSDGVRLGATLFLPRIEAPIPGAVFIQGSGNSGRDNTWARIIASHLAEAGVAVLVPDKRGVGLSEGDWRRMGFEERGADALAGSRFLRSRPELDPGRVGLVGLSQGGWVAPLAAARDDSVAFVVTVSSATVTFAEQSFHEMANTARQAGLDGPSVETVLAVNRAAGRYAVTGDWEPYRRLRSRHLEGPAGPVVEGFPAEPDDPIWTFIRKVMDYDPLPYWTVLRQPALVFFGSEDERDNVPVAESVRRLEFALGIAGKESAEIVVIEGADHGFIDMERHRLLPAFTERLTAWVREVTSGVGPGA